MKGIYISQFWILSAATAKKKHTHTQTVSISNWMECDFVGV